MNRGVSPAFEKYVCESKGKERKGKERKGNVCVLQLLLPNSLASCFMPSKSLRAKNCELRRA